MSSQIPDVFNSLAGIRYLPYELSCLVIVGRNQGKHCSQLF